MQPSSVPIKKAVIAAAGFGTRFLPQTKSFPKEMLPIVDKPVIQYIVEELVEAGIEDIVLVTGYHKRAIEDHFDAPSADLVEKLEASGKTKELEIVNKVSNLANFIYIRQKGHQGNATPLINAEHIIGNEPFIYTFADDFFFGTPSRFKQMVDLYNQYGGNVLCCKKINEPKEYSQYGIVAGEQIADGLINVKTIVEKPGPENPPSDLASVSGYILQPEIFNYIREAMPHHDPATGEFTQQPMMQQMINEGHIFRALEIKNAKYYDSGNKLDYVKTVIDFALRNPEISEELREYLRKTVS
ncbi:MAG: UTP--glucose-1-phosphate uridylyltransferase [Patescibacteria group bacterium]